MMVGVVETVVLRHLGGGRGWKGGRYAPLEASPPRTSPAYNIDNKLMFTGENIAT